MHECGYQLARNDHHPCKGTWKVCLERNRSEHPGMNLERGKASLYHRANEIRNCSPPLFALLCWFNSTNELLCPIEQKLRCRRSPFQIGWLVRSLIDVHRCTQSHDLVDSDVYCLDRLCRIMIDRSTLTASHHGGGGQKQWSRCPHTRVKQSIYVYISV